MSKHKQKNQVDTRHGTETDNGGLEGRTIGPDIADTIEDGAGEGEEEGSTR